MPRPTTHRYIIMFRQLNKARWTLDSGSDDLTAAQYNAFVAVAKNKEVAESRVRDQKTGSIVFTVTTNRETAVARRQNQ